jgi:cell division FtsZ-interacting protein ZapD
MATKATLTAVPDQEVSELDIVKAELDNAKAELHRALTQNLRNENLLSLTRQQLSNVMFQCAGLDLEVAILKSQLPA